MTPANVVQQPIGDALQPLMQEAKKHKTADEFGQAMCKRFKILEICQES